jgi:hypothetical protein
MLNIFYTYLKSLFIIDFSDYSGSLPIELLEMYEYVEPVFKIVSIVFIFYLIFNFFIFVVSLGGVRND